MTYRDDILFGVEPINSVISWLVGLFLGSLASGIAIIAVASIGISMFTGRIPLRRALRLVLGCFVLFGALTMSRGIIGTIIGAEDGGDTAGNVSPGPFPPPSAPAQAGSRLNDPYAGASLPPR
jgi:hypothetical protein